MRQLVAGPGHGGRDEKAFSLAFVTAFPCIPRSYKCAVVLCDMSWLDPDMEVANGIAATEQSDMLRLDAMILMVQLNIRKLIEEAAQPDINIITGGFY